MQALKHDGYYWIYNPYLKKKTVRKKARDIFKLIVESAWASGDPGLIFIDRINHSNPTRELGPITA
ncbi:MAG TPA: ribonucleoside-diphosphate reductase, adenosylcobalamin-dependent, partial [Acidobacteria bacterium]|nr:ribonucleoside-diphosphate reductase, adenosylcobalamin-dependent [Acidobacteriota bacterium]